VQEENGKWDFPGGGLNWGASPQEDLAREIQEEMGLKTTWTAKEPSYFFTLYSSRKTIYQMNIFYETCVASYDFIPSEECVSFKFITKQEAPALTPQESIVTKLAERFDPTKHQSHKE
jgi:8-oxo-dGTP diphosphatase